ncbi:hypothetical protein AURDEDRAFT_189151 [Auricularia subglabra TFB-10046 SS5]|uniref:Uncharacterized protein n=1 Tax=Auricularia subglabra (strain TFB-10046 / SS5) TaxID=717982 RepID=J0CPR1_AURST|nr:hypothetical protein AURDEDRAFT_189151 [Auricularia subglabra TFB-10046 SS5]
MLQDCARLFRPSAAQRRVLLRAGFDVFRVPASDLRRSDQPEDAALAATRVRALFATGLDVAQLSTRRPHSPVPSRATLQRRRCPSPCGKNARRSSAPREQLRWPLRCRASSGSLLGDGALFVGGFSLPAAVTCWHRPSREQIAPPVSRRTPASHHRGARCRRVLRRIPAAETRRHDLPAIKPPRPSLAGHHRGA